MSEKSTSYKVHVKVALGPASNPLIQAGDYFMFLHVEAKSEGAYPLDYHLRAKEFYELADTLGPLAVGQIRLAFNLALEHATVVVDEAPTAPTPVEPSPEDFTLPDEKDPRANFWAGVTDPARVEFHALPDEEDTWETMGEDHED